jgi:hypothetical protein
MGSNVPSEPLDYERPGQLRKRELAPWEFTLLMLGMYVAGAVLIIIVAAFMMAARVYRQL